MGIQQSLTQSYIEQNKGGTTRDSITKKMSARKNEPLKVTSIIQEEEDMVFSKSFHEAINSQSNHLRGASNSSNEIEVNLERP